MKFSALFCLATLTSVLAAPADLGSTSAVPGTKLLAQAIGEAAQAEFPLERFCPAAFLAHLENVERVGIEFWDWSPNNKMSYKEFRAKSLQYGLSRWDALWAVQTRQDPEKLKKFHEEFTEEEFHDVGQVDGFKSDITVFFQYDQLADAAEEEAAQAVASAVLKMHAAWKAREEAEEWRKRAAAEMVRYDCNKVKYEAWLELPPLVST